MAGDGFILKVENVNHIGGGFSTIGMLFVSAYSLKFITAEESDVDSGDVKSASQVLFDIPVASIARIERTEQAKDEAVIIYTKDLQEVVLSFKRSARKGDADTFIGNVEPLLSNDGALFAFFSKESYTYDGWNLYDPIKEYKRMRMPDDYIRISTLNENYEFAPTYPSVLLTPTVVTDKDLRASGAFRSKNRVITICWRDVASWKVIARCSQPLVGLRNKTNTCDSTLIKSLGEWAASTNKDQFFGADAEGKPLKPVSILDARPRLNAVGNMANGGGFENTENVEANLAFLNVENIHVVRDAMATFRDLFAKTVEIRTTAAPRSSEYYAEKYFIIWNALRRNDRPTTWFPMLGSIISGGISCVECIEAGRSVIVHCSDGWDRTPQVTSIAQLLLDGYYRTLTGFAVLIEKEWLSFGHKFAERCGHGANRAKYQDKQRSPIFIQWLDCVYQLLCQRAEAFEFNSDLLVFLAENVYSCRFGTFLTDTERDRKELKEKTCSIWSYVIDNRQKFVNPSYVKADSPLRVHGNSRDFSLWLDYYIRWDRALFLNPDEEIPRIKACFQANFRSKPRKTAKTITGPSFQSSLTSSMIAAGQSATGGGGGGSKSPKISAMIPDSPTLEDDGESYANWYDQMSARMESQADLKVDGDDWDY
eukprot:TRINITY_DN4339_c0_g1_i1.p1 TRINITY_DN4339_c0_g1~~TRINITY_DN4339_c0_g1_i1.p1  ORF type:complete len:689 (+),score=159.07 TRINITY_DN4339_c0_g1_i1:116-2068(+)